jgi:hypothetical protein
VTGNPIEIDGVPVTPVVERCDFYGLDFKDFARRAQSRPVSMVSARVGIILSYPLTRSPGSLKVTWDRFNKYVWAINMMVHSGGTVTPVTLSRLGANNEFFWKAPGPVTAPALSEVLVELPPRRKLCVPWLSAGCFLLMPAVVLALKRRGAVTRRYLSALAVLLLAAVVSWPWLRCEVPDPFAAARVPDEVAADTFSVLHENMYRAFAYRSEERIYDALSNSVHGELLSDLYLQIRRGLEMQEQGGAVSRVRDVSVLASRREPLPPEGQHDERGFGYRCRWNVSGTVEHWGHVHSRTSQYEALFKIEPCDDAWKITDIQLLTKPA